MRAPHGHVRHQKRISLLFRFLSVPTLPAIFGGKPASLPTMPSSLLGPRSMRRLVRLGFCEPHKRARCGAYLIINATALRAKRDCGNGGQANDALGTTDGDNGASQRPTTSAASTSVADRVYASASPSQRRRKTFPRLPGGSDPRAPAVVLDRRLLGRNPSAATSCEYSGRLR